LAPFVLVVAIGWGWAVADLAVRARQAVVLVVAPVLVLPAAGWAVSGDLAAVSWPSDWSVVATASRSLPPGPVLVLPWASVRMYPWNGDRPMIDPANRWIDRRVVGDGRLFVRGADGEVRSTPQEDPAARAIGVAAQGVGQLTGALRSRGYAGVIVERDVFGGGQQAARLRGEQLVASTPTLALYAVSGTASTSVPSGSVAGTLAGDAAALLAVIISGTICWVLAVQRRRTV
jgi:hypothetical protein